MKADPGIVEVERPVAPADRFTTVDSPIGPLVLIGNGQQLLGLHFSAPDQVGADGLRDDPAAFAGAIDQLAEYFAGEREEFTVRLAPPGAGFNLRVWQALLTIPYGSTASYGRIAEQIGVPGSARAVGAANHVNPIAIIIPCHRVIGADGSLVGYGGGLRTKEFLLALEAPTLF